MRRSPVMLLGVALFLGSCGGAGGRAGSPLPSTTSHSTSPSRDRYLANTTVLESPEHGPSMCLGGILESLPPQCGDVPVTNWDWDQVEGEEAVSGTTWGTYQVIGTYDGTSFTLTEPPGPPDLARPDEEPIESPCPEPDGGWQVADPGRVAQADFEAAQAWARGRPDFAGLWVDHIVQPTEFEEPSNLILNAAFTGDLGANEAGLQARWGGALCVVGHERSFRELEQIQRELVDEGGIGSLDLHLLTASIDEVDNVVQVFVVLVRPDSEQILADHYGEGTVELSGALEPVD